MRKVIITAALTGGLHGKNVNPNLPEQPDEIAQQAYECHKEGAAIVHLHARDSDGNGSADPEIFKEIHQKIRKKCDIIIQDSTGGSPHLTIEEKIRCVIEAKPEMASLNMGTLVRVKAKGDFRNSIFKNTPDDINDIAKALLEANIKPELEVYSHSMLEDVEKLISNKLIKKPYYINFVMGMGYQGAEKAHRKNLISLINFLPPDSIFNVCAVGKEQLELTTLSVLLGGNCRVGLEDNIYIRKGVLAKNNAQLVKRSARIIKELNIKLATPDEAREILQIKKN
ncbi:3-keto-5-aminohexanoate cleavage protein [bacterium]|nr:3-keto-5-aminohexanoate cleavage protein [bacterium]